MDQPLVLSLVPVPEMNESLALMTVIGETFIESPWCDGREKAQCVRHNGWHIACRCEWLLVTKVRQTHSTSGQLRAIRGRNPGSMHSCCASWRSSVEHFSDGDLAVV